ncbi:MAG: cytochrome c [Phycisphaeraceae bacterium]|nr:cytochrome c [Phycisphaerae bacterium]MBX3392092.1 cytochrome c [Phycisphaeraceae bacterium]
MKADTKTTWGAARLAAVALATAAVMAGCRGGRSDNPPREFFPDLDNQMKWKPQDGSGFFADGRTMRRPVAGSVPYGRVNFYVGEADLEGSKPWARRWMEEREDFLKADDAVYTGKNGSGEYLDRIPMAVTRPMLDLGRQQYNIYCSVCHGYLGDGQGMVGKNWSAPLPSFHDPKYSPGATEEYTDEATRQTRTRPARTGQDGYLFSVAREGVWDVQGNNKMPGYGHALSERESWAVVAYIRALRESRGVKIDDPSIPRGQRDALVRGRPSSAGDSADNGGQP